MNKGLTLEPAPFIMYFVKKKRKSLKIKIEGMRDADIWGGCLIFSFYQFLNRSLDFKMN